MYSEYHYVYFYRVTELFTWMLEITEDATEQYDGARIVWSARFEPHQEDSETLETHRGEGKKTTTRFDIQKDDIQAVVPISKVSLKLSFFF